ncbi:MAG: C4-dicarboxylate TRAP transporter substrate-binding protein [Desulfobacterales bacterium]|nr:MAG: C4-dicarboxylate TRAP transporter substrate-binding protein [Desulfobacterales bacterium]
MKTSKKMMISAMLVILVLVFVCAAAQAKAKYVLKFNHVLAPTDPFHAGFEKWAKAVGERTKGEVEIQVFHSAQLGVEEDIIEQIRAGANLGQNTDSARMGNYVPEIAVMNGPYFVDNYHDVFKLPALPSVKGWKSKLEKDFGIKILSFNWVQGFRHMIAQKPIKTPEDLNGLRIRTPGAPIWQESIRSIGATPVALAFGEIYPAMQQKVIDGCDNVYNATYAGRLYEVASHLSETAHILLINFEIMSAKYFNSLPAEYQQIIEEEMEKAGIETSKLVMDKYSAESKQKLIEKGMTVVEDVDMDAFRKAGEKAYEVLGISDARKQVYKELGK